MAGLNTTGLPQTNDYNLGRGIVYFSALDSTTGLPDASGYRDLGNAPEFNITVETEDLEHQSSRQGLKVTDKRFVISQTINISLTLDELNFQNMALFMSGTTETYDNPHDTTFVDVVITASIVQGRWYDLHDSSITKDRVYNLDAAGTVIAIHNDTPVPAVVTTDYVLDAKMGRIMVVVGSTVLAAGDQLEFDISTGATVAVDLDQVNALTEGSIAGAMKFIAENPGDSDKNVEYQFHQVQISAEGDFALIGDEVTTLQMTGVAESNSNVSDTSKILTVRTYDAQ